MAEPSGAEEAEVAAAVARYRLVSPRSALAGRLGGVLGKQAGGSMELLDFREYQPGDDVRQLDWNAAARLDTMVVRVRREEVSPRLEVVLDASRSMEIHPSKAARARQLAGLLVPLARRDGLDPLLVIAGDEARAHRPAHPDQLRNMVFDGRRTLADHLSRGLGLRPCGLRIVVSDFLFEAPLDVTCRQLTNGAATTVLVQLLAAEDESPAGGGTTRLVDSETGETLERRLTEDVLASYRERFAAHAAALETAARRVRAAVVKVAADEPLDAALRGRLVGTVLEARP